MEEEFEEDKDNESGSYLSESEKGFGNKHKAIIRSYRFVYPTLAKYRTKSEVRLYAFPPALKNSWLSFNPAVLAEAFSILPGANTSKSIGNTLRNHSYMRKQKTILLGIPKELAHKNPVETFRRTSLRGGAFEEGIMKMQNDQLKVPQGLNNYN